jgi:hypothetical protein
MNSGHSRWQRPAIPLACSLCFFGILVALVIVLWGWWGESPEVGRLRARLEAADPGWHNVELRRRVENGARVIFAAGTYRLGDKRYSIMLLAREGAEAVTVEVEDADESRLVARWAPPAEPTQTLPDANLGTHWDKAKRLMRQLREAFAEGR